MPLPVKRGGFGIGLALAKERQTVRQTLSINAWGDDLGSLSGTPTRAPRVNHDDPPAIDSVAPIIETLARDDDLIAVLRANSTLRPCLVDCVRKSV
jgi:hypothetical protein